MEPKVNKYLPTLVMSDYMVDYTNHSGYRGGKEGKMRGSAARLYTDIPMKELVLPSTGYTYVHI